MQQELAMAFPSENFALTISAAQKKIDDLKLEHAALARKVELTTQSRAVIELSGGDPDSELRRLRGEIANNERAQVAARQEIQQRFEDARNSHAIARQSVWETRYVETVQTTTTQVAALVSTLRRMSQELAALKSAPVAGIVTASTIDAGVATHNELVAKHKLPSNLLIDPSNSLAFCFQHAVREALKQSGLEAAIKELRENLESLDKKQLITQFEAARASAPDSRKLWARR
jgi:hypothetical protein